MRKFLIPLALFLSFGSNLAAGTTTDEFDVSPGETVEFDLDTGGDIEVVGGAGNTATVTIRIEGRNAEGVEATSRRTANGIEIHTRDRGGNGWGRDVKITVKVPTRFDVDLDSMGGDVELRDLEGNFEGRTMGGDIVLRSLNGKAKLTTMGGDIDVNDSDLDGKVSTMGGDVNFDNVAGSIDGSTMGGDVTRTNDRRSGSGSASAVKIDSFGGDIKVDQAPNGAEVETMGGDIRVASVDNFLKATTMGGDIDVRAATGETEVLTMGGDITFDSFDGDLEATTMGGDIEVTVDGYATAGSHDIELESMGGDLTVILPADFSARFDIELVKLRKREEKARIDSDFDLDIDEPADWSPRGSGRDGRRYGDSHKIIRATGVTGGGEHLVRLKTINGVIRIVRR